MTSRQVSEFLHELYRPPGEPSAQVIFFHGFQPHNYKDSHLSTWMSRDGSTVWPQTWLVEDFPDASFLTVSYEALKFHERSPKTIWDIPQILLSDLIQAGVGQVAFCPVILVGHSFGGLIIKALCLEARRMGTIETRNFLTNVKGFFFYSMPSFGLETKSITQLLSESPLPDSLLKDYLEILSHEGARRNFEFDHLRYQYTKWRTAALGESVPTKLGFMNAVVVSEAEARCGAEIFNMVHAADHFQICRPNWKSDRGFYSLSTFINAIVEEEEQVPIHQLEEHARYPICLEFRVRAISRLQDTRVIGLLGPSGIGKTTLAIKLFNTISWDFEYTCFLENARGIPIDGLEDRILSSFYYRGTRVNRMQWHDLQEKKILVVLDDLNSDTQVKFLPALDSCEDGSKLIITSRDKDIIESFESCGIYGVNLLGPEDAKLLFCQHAFGQKRIPEGSLKENDYLEDAVFRVVNICEGLPFALELVGCYFRGHDSEPSFWSQTIESINAHRSFNDKVRALWRWSYDSLQEEEQRMFLEAATYFCGQPLDEALAAWRTSIKHNPETVWQNLLNRAMVKEVRRSKYARWDSMCDREIEYMEVYVHEELRHLASGILDPGNPALISGEHIINDTVLVNTKWLRADRRAETNKQLPHLDTTISSNFQELEYLDMDSVMLEGSHKIIPSKLSLLKWKMTSTSTLPSIDLEKMERLAVLELVNWKIPKELSQALGNLSNLGVLSLCQLEGLNQLPPSFGNLSKLNRLELVGLGLKTLPDSFGHLLSLEHFTIFDCLLLSHLPSSFGQLKALKMLTIRQLDQLELLPESFGQLVALKHLTIVRCPRLHVLPVSFCRLMALQILTIGPVDQVELLSDSIVQAYGENEDFIVTLDIDWRHVRDRSLRAKIDVYRERNAKLSKLKYTLKEEDKPKEEDKAKEQDKVEEQSQPSEEQNPEEAKANEERDSEEENRNQLRPTCAKIFLCGYPEVGKTRLRKTLIRSGGDLSCLPLWCLIQWETLPNLSKEPRTRGIEVSRLEETASNEDKTSLLLWDLAGQHEFHVLHGTFFPDLGFARGKATTFVLVFRALVPQGAENKLEEKLLYWLRFVASSSQKIQTHEKQVPKPRKRHVLIVLNRFNGQLCKDHDQGLWRNWIKKYSEMFNAWFDIRREPFIIDVRVAGLVQPLKDHLFEHVQTMLKEEQSMPSLCFELQAEVKAKWPQGTRNRHFPILTWQAFETALDFKRKGKKFTTQALKAAALYLHDTTGEIVYFDDPESMDRSIVVPDPTWFCKEIVGHLLLNQGMAKEESLVIVTDDGLISIDNFTAYFQERLPQGTRSDDVISMLEKMGLCFRQGVDEKDEHIIVPALIQSFDDYTSMGWESEGCGTVMGRCLVVQDRATTAFPATLFRRLQVKLRKDQKLGGRKDAKYRAGRSFSIFRVGRHLVLIQFDEDDQVPGDDRIDILVKNMNEGEDPTQVSLGQVKLICEIMEKLENLCVTCCSGVEHEIHVIWPWKSTDSTPTMIKRVLMPLKEIERLVLDGETHISWELEKNKPLELKIFLSNGEHKALQDQIVASNATAESSPGELMQSVRSAGLLREDSLKSRNESAEENSSKVAPLVPEIASVEKQKNDHQGFDEVVISAKEKQGDERQEDALTKDPNVILEVGEPSEHPGAASTKHREDVGIVREGRREGGESRSFYAEVSYQASTSVLHEGDWGSEQFENVPRMFDLIMKKLDHMCDVGESNLKVSQENKELLQKLQTSVEFFSQDSKRKCPRFIYVEERNSRINKVLPAMISWKRYYCLRFACEAKFEDSGHHEVQGQQGLHMEQLKDWARNVGAPWLKVSLTILLLSANIAANVVLPGVGLVIPGFVQYQQLSAITGGVALATALSRDELGKLIEEMGVDINDVDRNPHELYGKSIEAIDKLLGKLTPDAYEKKVGLQKVSLYHGQHSLQKVVYICAECYKKYDADPGTTIKRL